MKRALLILALLLASCAAQQLLSEHRARQPRWPYALPPPPTDSLAPRVVAMPDSLRILPWLLERAAQRRVGAPK